MQRRETIVRIMKAFVHVILQTVPTVTGAIMRTVRAIAPSTLVIILLHAGVRIHARLGDFAITINAATATAQENCVAVRVL